MLPLRYLWFWWALGGLLVAGVMIGSLMPAPQVPDVGLSDKLLHAGAYGVLMFWFSGLYKRRRHWVVASALVLLGLVLDIAQGATATRSFDFGDVAANAGGILLALVLARFVFGGWCQRVEQWFFA